jgi:transcription termination factor Rho
LSTSGPRKSPTQRSVDGEVISSTSTRRQRRAGRGDGHREGEASRRAQGDVLILLDSVTRLARAYNTVIPPSGKVPRAVSIRTPCRSRALLRRHKKNRRGGS